MLALLEGIPVLASLIGADDSIGVDPPYCESVLLGDVTPLLTESWQWHLLVESEGFQYQ